VHAAQTVTDNVVRLIDAFRAKALPVVLVHVEQQMSVPGRKGRGSSD
jgi:nicotinamidase-related amidase